MRMAAEPAKMTVMLGDGNGMSYTHIFVVMDG
jgi:hypothetical protein